MTDRLPVFPLETKVNKDGHLEIGGCDATELARKFGTPLYIYDEHTLRAKCREFKEEFGKRYPDIGVIYASKAYSNAAILQIVNEEGLGLDVVSGGELGIARMAKFPMKRVYFHGNNKSLPELEMALKYKVGRIVVDNFYELEMLGKLAQEKDVKPSILLRITPGVDPHTHTYTSTGTIDSKFGFPLPLKEEAVARALKIKSLDLVGLHFHIGSRITETAPYLESVKFILKFAAEMRKQYGFELKELNTGGGYDVRYTLDEKPPAFGEFAEKITTTIKNECKKWHMDIPHLVVEPGREIVAQSGVALYQIGVVKEIPGVRTYVAVDGGMGDNIRPALYNARLEAVIANRMKAKMAGKVTICGKFCESGDILIKDIELPEMKAGDILALNGAGAYAIPESMNYNAFFRPPVILVKDGKSRLIRRRETLEDITRCDVME
ncbi:MAG: diaminopimelate decarboxylase [Dehalococcoidales bacterium]|nr:diaminopimelate decarboxylase [Dehalococcoidales bacterium]